MSVIFGQFKQDRHFLPCVQLFVVCSMMSRGIVALFGTHRASSINAIKSYTSTFQMPFITPSMALNTTGQQKDFELYMSPLYAGALVSIIKKYEWRKIYYLYSDDEGRLNPYPYAALAPTGSAMLLPYTLPARRLSRGRPESNYGMGN